MPGPQTSALGRAGLLAAFAAVCFATAARAQSPVAPPSPPGTAVPVTGAMAAPPVATPPPAAAPAPVLPMDTYPIARLRMLDKITARTSTFDVHVDTTVRFGPLYIRPRTCKKASPLATPEAASFLQIWETPPKQDARWLFSGWMFASSPALSSMDDPIYDVWVLDCGGDLPPAPVVASSPAAQPGFASTGGIAQPGFSSAAVGYSSASVGYSSAAIGYSSAGRATAVDFDSSGAQAIPETATPGLDRDDSDTDTGPGAEDTPPPRRTSPGSATPDASAPGATSSPSVDNPIY